MRNENYIDPTPIAYCAMCGDPIYWGDHIFETKYGEYLHAEGTYRDYRERGTNEVLRLTCAETWAIETGGTEELTKAAALEVKRWE